MMEYEALVSVVKVCVSQNKHAIFWIPLDLWRVDTLSVCLLTISNLLDH